MKINKRVAFPLLIILLLLSTIICVQLIKEGLQHSNTQIYFARAGKNFDTGSYGQSIKFSLIGIRNALEGGLRWTIGKPHLMKAQTMLYEGKDLYGALDECELANTIIGSAYDDEGMVSYLCLRIKTEINPDVWQNPLLPVSTKTLEP
jgi:hypothetical protein